MGDKQEIRQFIKVYYFPITLYTNVISQLGKAQGKAISILKHLN